MRRDKKKQVANAVQPQIPLTYKENFYIVEAVGNG